MTVYVPKGKLKTLETKLNEYETQLTKVRQRPKNEAWAAPIEKIRRAALEAFWTDDFHQLPSTDEVTWLEVWLLSEDNDPLQEIREAAQSLGFEVGPRSLHFPERLVILVRASIRQLAASIDVLDSIAEFRRPREISSEYRALSPRDMQDWSEDLLSRVQSTGPEMNAIHILDTGINQHPLLKPFLEEQDTHSIRPAWGRDDHDGHGTAMAGVALYGDLAQALGQSGPVEVPAVLESTKILPRIGTNEPELWGAITQQAVLLPEIEQPRRQRCHVMAVTADQASGRPTSWSGAVDQLIAGSIEDGAAPRLMIISAGNSPRTAWETYPDHLETSRIQDPAQAWNALVLGACTELHEISESDFGGWEPVASRGDLSPSSSTSNAWIHDAPLKPDLVLEGGNCARDAAGQIDTPDSLGLLTTHHRSDIRPFTITGDTSAASAQAARYAAFLQANYPDYWPETIRALLVHSARWTPQMEQRFGPLKSKDSYKRLVRACGFGVPSLERALWSVQNRLTLVVQESLQPFSKRNPTSKKLRATPGLHEMHFHELPWPRAELLDLGQMEVQLRVTLSYFVEPSPGERGWQSRYRYASHGLRFDLRATNEREEDFKKRLNKAAREENEESPGTGDTSGWSLGPKLRHRGSLHSDVWVGTAADLADRGQVGIFPIGGWWKDRPHLGRWNQKTRYALVVSIEAPEIDVDLYTSVVNQIASTIDIS